MGKLGWVLGLVCLLLLASEASAQTVTVTIASVSRERANDDHLANSAISLADCVEQDVMRFELNFSAGYQSYALEAWAGEACDERTSRVGPSANCWKVYDAQPSQLVHTATIPVQDVLSGRTGGRENGAIPSACVATSSSTAPQQLSVYFLLVDGAAYAVASTSFRANYKLNASPRPDFVFATPGDGKLLLDFGFDGSIDDTFLDGYRFFCEPAERCGAPTLLVPGSFVDSKIEALQCGTADRRESSGFAEGLENGVSYNVSVASVDTYGNVSTLSALGCAAPVQAPADPEPSSGSDQTSSACSFSAHREPLPVLAVLALTSLVMARRRESAQSGQNCRER